MGKIASFLSNFFILIVKAYQYLLSPMLGNRCRFYPSCSSYAIDAFRLHGFFRGCYLTLKRIFNCHPWHSGGIDLVPEKKPNDY